MIAGIGVDIAETNRFEALYERYGERFSQRLLTVYEQEQLSARPVPERFLATRFAAKEAAAKALGTGFDQGVGYKGIEVRNNEYGKPELFFYGTALELVKQRQISSFHLSISDEKYYVVAMVVLETS